MIRFQLDHGIFYVRKEYLSSYIHFTDEQKEQARQTDLVSLLESQGETVKRSGKEFE